MFGMVHLPSVFVICPSAAVKAGKASWKYSSKLAIIYLGNNFL